MYDGTVEDERDFTALGGDAEAIRERLAAGWRDGLTEDGGDPARRHRPSPDPIARCRPTSSKRRCSSGAMGGAASGVSS